VSLYVVLKELLKIRATASRAPESPYKDGYLDAMEACIEVVEEELDD